MCWLHKAWDMVGSGDAAFMIGMLYSEGIDGDDEIDDRDVNAFINSSSKVSSSSTVSVWNHSSRPGQHSFSPFINSPWGSLDPELASGKPIYR